MGTRVPHTLTGHQLRIRYNIPLKCMRIVSYDLENKSSNTNQMLSFFFIKYFFIQ